MLQSSLIGGSDDLNFVASRGRVIKAPESSDAVVRIQSALICLGFELPEAGIDGVFGEEVSSAIVAFKTDRGIFPNDPAVGEGTTKRLDLEIAYLEGVTGEDVLEEPRVLASDPFFGGILDTLHPDRSIPDKILEFFRITIDEFCFPLNDLFGTVVSSMVGRLVERPIADDYCKLQGPCVGEDFFDLDANAQIAYTNFLRTRNPLIPEATIIAIGSSVRPDILRHRNDFQEWYEIKPLSPSGVTEFLIKGKQLRANYDSTFPYLPGKKYTPSRQIPLKLGFFEGDKLEIFIDAIRPATGMILYRICVKGDYVRYFRRVGFIAGILAILAFLLPEILAGGAAAGEVAAFSETILGLAARFGVALPTLVPTL